MVGMNVSGSNISGAVTSFMRWPPVAAPSMAAGSAIIGAEKFAGASALVIGGSRGLGAVTAKAIAAGGGKVVITYVQGRDEAGKLAAEIYAARGPDVCIALAYDSSSDAARQLSDLPEDINQLYYFATPPIFRELRICFLRKFREFCSVYVDGFYDVCRFVRARSRAPSSRCFIHLRSRWRKPAGLAEYAMAKAAGEILCAAMMTQVSG